MSVFAGLAVLMFVLGAGVLAVVAQRPPLRAIMLSAAVLWLAGVFFGLQGLAYWRLSIKESDREVCLRLPRIWLGVFWPPFATVCFQWREVQRLTVVERVIRVPNTAIGSSMEMPHSVLVIEGAGRRAVLTRALIKVEFSGFVRHLAERTGVAVTTRWC